MAAGRSGGQRRRSGGRRRTSDEREHRRTGGRAQRTDPRSPPSNDLVVKLPAARNFIAGHNQPVVGRRTPQEALSFSTWKGPSVTENPSPALQVALAYHQAWTRKDLDQAMSYIAEDIVCDAPAGRIEGAEAYRAFMAPFVQILISSRVIAAFGNDETALVMYDTETAPVKSAPGAECVTVRDGKIAYSRFVFDRTPFEAARKAAAT
jgi:SnoaL-like domain